MTSEQAAMMTRLQHLGLTMDDLRIYLDTHLYDSYAIERYNMAAQEYQDIAAQYSKQFSPLSANLADNSSSDWNWGLSAFPWDY